jgi:hypothetical protein
MAKIIGKHKPAWLEASNIVDVYSVSSCVNDDFDADIYATPIYEALRNEQGLYNSVDDIRTAAQSASIDLQEATLFYYEVHPLELDGKCWLPLEPDVSAENRVEQPTNKVLQGFDVVTLCDGPNSHSPLSCNSIAQDVATDSHCLLETFAEAELHLNNGSFDDGEPGPYRIYAVYRVR